MTQLIHLAQVRTPSGKTLTGGAGWAAVESAVKRGQSKKKGRK